jgi:hypothetical protein
VFGTAYGTSEQEWNQRYRPWIDHIRSCGLIHDQILLVDDGSPWLPKWDDVEIFDAGSDHDSNSAVCLAHFSTGKGVPLHEGWYRSFGHALEYALTRGYNRVIHIESDAYLISAGAIHKFNNTHQGWLTLWCPTYCFPESALQVINQDQLSLAHEFFQQPITDVQGEKVNHTVIEQLLPFTQVDQTLKGDRYNEFGHEVPGDADFAAQCLVSQYPAWWLHGNRGAADPPS